MPFLVVLVALLAIDWGVWVFLLWLLGVALLPLVVMAGFATAVHGLAAHAHRSRHYVDPAEDLDVAAQRQLRATLQAIDAVASSRANREGQLPGGFSAGVWRLL